MRPTVTPREARGTWDGLTGAAAVAIMYVMASRLFKHDAAIIPAGQNPVPDHVEAGGVIRLRGWQGQAYEALRGRLQAIMLAPTSAGKSVAIKAIAVDELRRHPRAKVIVAVPQYVIASSFGREVIRLPDGSVETFDVDVNLINVCASVDALVAFVNGGPADGRVCVCTHQTLVLAHAKFMRGHKGKRSPWEGVCLFIDEAHHSRAEDGDDGGETVDEARKANNKLGQLVAHWVKAKPGNILLTTATWFRKELEDIVPRAALDEFSRFVLPMHEHLAQMNWVREIAIRFLIGKPEDAIRALRDERTAKTVMWMPHVASPYVRRAGGKYAALASYLDALGAESVSDEWTVTRGKVRVMDLVTEAGRAARRDAFMLAVSSGKQLVARSLSRVKDHQAMTTGERASCVSAARQAAKGTPDFLVALGMAKEGFDWPEASRGICIGERGSLVDIMQMMGRVGRDYPGKRCVEFNIVLPYTGEEKADPEMVRSYLKAFMTMMAAEIVLTGSWPKRKTADGAESVDDVDVMRNATALSEAVVDTVIRNPDASADDMIRGAVTASGIEADEDHARDIGTMLRRMLSSRSARMAAEIAADGGRVDVVEGDLGAVGMVAALLGHANLRKMRDDLGMRSNLSEDMISAWVDEHIKATGTFPSTKSGIVPGGVVTWKVIDNALRFGDRGMPGGSSLSKFINCGARRLTEADISAWICRHHEATGRWPTSRAEVVSDCPRLTWVNVDDNLKYGRFGLAGGSSLAALVVKCGKDARKYDRTYLSVEMIVMWIGDHWQRTGTYPTERSGRVLACPRETWSCVSHALRGGLRGLAKGHRLASLVDERFSRERKAILTVDALIRVIGDHYHKTGRYPTAASPDIGGQHGRVYDSCLRMGHRGLPGGSSLAKFIDEHFRSAEAVAAE